MLYRGRYSDLQPLFWITDITCPARFRVSCRITPDNNPTGRISGILYPTGYRGCAVSSQVSLCPGHGGILPIISVPSIIDDVHSLCPKRMTVTAASFLWPALLEGPYLLVTGGDTEAFYDHGESQRHPRPVQGNISIYNRIRYIFMYNIIMMRLNIHESINNPGECCVSCSFTFPWIMLHWISYVTRFVSSVPSETFCCVPLYDVRKVIPPCIIIDMFSSITSR